MKWSEERKKQHSKMALKKGYGKWMNGKKFSEETKKKLSLKKKGKPFSGTICDWNGKKHTEESKKKMSVAHKGKKLSIKTRKKMSESNKGEKSCLWKGGLTSKNKTIRDNVDYRLWRESVFERDNWTCQECRKIGGYLEAHHIKSFSKFSRLRFKKSNGITLCKDCHKKTDNYGNTKNTQE